MRRRLTYLLFAFVVTTSGCSHFAKIPMWSPATAQIEGIQTVAVLPFEGEWGTRVAEEVSDAFSDSGTYTIISASSLPTIQSASAESDSESPALDQVLIAARKADIDAVLTGTIIEEESRAPQNDTRTTLSRKPSQRDRPLLNRSMTVEYRLIDTRTGETLSQNRISCLESALPASHDTVKQTLIQRCGYEVVSQLTPQCSDCSIALANCHWMNRGGFSVRKGVRAAEHGNWESATASWKSALRANPKNDAAIFNLALAAASQGNFDEAEDLALQAIRIQHCDCYENGLEKIRLQRSQFESASHQRSGIKLSSTESQER